MLPPHLTKDDLAQLRNYVASGETGMRKAESTVIVHISHSNLKANFFEIRLDLHMTVESIKLKLATHTGTTPSAMRLVLKDETGKAMYEMDDDTRKFGFYSPYDGCTIHIIDLDPHSLSACGGLEDVSQVEKFVISEEAYNRRDNTFRKYKEAKLKEDPTWTLEKEMATRRGEAYVEKKTFEDDAFVAEASGVKVGERCSAEPGDRRGVVRFVGKVDGLPAGFWVGIHYDEPVGKNDGSVKGKKLFDAPPGYGGFVRPDKVKTGDYPPLDDFLGSDDEI